MRVGIYEAKTHFAKLIMDVQKGERVTITKHGIPIAILIPTKSTGVIDLAVAISELRGFNKGRFAGASLKTMREEGRR
jgi:prevent-host-death family protein